MEEVQVVTSPCKALDYSLFGPYTRFLSEEASPRNRFCNVRFQFIAKNSQDARSSAKRRSSLYTYITSLAAAIVHCGYGRSINSKSTPAWTYPSCNTRKYHPVLPLFWIRNEKSTVRHLRAGRSEERRVGKAR